MTFHFNNGSHKQFCEKLIAQTVFFSTCILLAASSYAQNLSEGGGPPIDPNISSGDQAIIRAVYQSNPQTPVELARAMATMLDLDATEQAKFYLTRLKALSLDDSQKFELYNQIGGNLFFELQFRESLAPDGEMFAKDVIRAANQFSFSPDRLQQLVRQLSSPDLSIRNQALRTLRKLGPQATAEILHVFVDSDRQAEFPYLRSALKLMGNDALGPLLAGSRANHLLVQAESVRALSHYPSAEAMDVKIRTYLSPKLPEPLRRIALDALMRIDRLPANPQIVESRFYDRAIAHLTGKMSAERILLGEVESFRWDNHTQKLVSSKIAATQANKLVAAQLALDLYEINPQSDRNRQLMLLTQLELNKRVIGPSSRMTAERLTSEIESEVSFEEIERVLRLAMKMSLIPAATAACEVLGDLSHTNSLRSRLTIPASLIEAIKMGDRHLQFAAFEAIQILDPQQPYAGSRLVLSLAVFFSFSSGQDAAIIGDGRIEQAQTYAGLMLSSGFRGVAAFNGKQLFANVTQDPDIGIVMLSDSISNPDVQQLVQQLRNDIRTKRTPIGVLQNQSTTSLGLDRLAANDPLLIVLPISLEVDQLVSHLRRVQQLADPWTVAATDRKRHAESAIRWLAQIATNGDQYRFYDLFSKQDDLTKILYMPNTIEPAAQILQALGTPNAQRELLNFVSQSNFPLEDRRKAAAAFAAVIKRNGTLLTKKEILQQYNRYNASETESVEIQQLLGSVLDALESNQSSR